MRRFAFVFVLALAGLAASQPIGVTAQGALPETCDREALSDALREIRLEAEASSDGFDEEAAKARMEPLIRVHCPDALPDQPGVLSRLPFGSGRLRVDLPLSLNGPADSARLGDNVSSTEDFFDQPRIDTPGTTAFFGEFNGSGIPNGWDFTGGDLTTLYMVTSADDLYSVNVATGIETPITFNMGNAGTPAGITWDPATSQMYMITQDPEQLYTLNLLNGQATLVAGLSPIFPEIYAVSADSSGQLWGYDSLDNLVQINKTTGAVTTVGDTGLDFFFSDFQAMDHDPVDGTMYLTSQDFTAPGGTFGNGAEFILDPLQPSGSIGQLVGTFPTTSGTFGNFPGQWAIELPWEALPQADIATSKSTLPPGITTVIAGNDLSYFIEAVNNGPDVSPGLTITDLLPGPVEFLDARPSDDGVCNFNAGTNTVDCVWRNDVEVQETRSVEIDVRICPEVTCTVAGGPTTLLNAAQGQPGTGVGGVADPDPTNNRAELTTDIEAQSRIEIDAFADKDEVVVGDNITYTVVVQNFGPSNASNTVVVNQLPPNFDLVNADSSQGTCSFDDPTDVVTCNIGQLGAPDQCATSFQDIVTITIVATAKSNLSEATPACPEGDVNFATQVSSANCLADTGTLEDGLATCVVPRVNPNVQLGRQVHLPILNFQGQDDVCRSWIEVQYIGCDPSKAVLVTWGDPGFCPPQAAGPLKVECTGLLNPGSSWNMLGAQIPTGSKSGILFKFTARQLSEVGLANDLGFDDVVADLMCETLFFGVVGDSDDYRRFKKAYNEGIDFAGIDQGIAAGSGILAVEVLRHCPGDITPGVEVSSKYNGISGAHLGQYDPIFGSFSYYVPLLYAEKAGLNTVMYIQNGGLQCSSVEIWFKSQDDCLRARICEIFTLAPGESYQWDASDCVGPDWQGSAWLRSSQELGIAVDIYGRDTLMTYIGEPAPYNFITSTDDDPDELLFRPGNRVGYGPLVYSEYQGWDTGVQVQNLNQTYNAKVKVYFLDRSGDVITTLVDWICPRGSQTFFLPVVADLPGSWVGSIRIESQNWWAPGGNEVTAPNILGVAQLMKYSDVARTETQEAIAYNLLPEHKAYLWQVGFGPGELDSGVGLIAIPSLLKDLDNTGTTSELAIANLVPKPGFTDFAIYIYDQNGLLDFVCQKLHDRQVEYIDLQTWGYVSNGFKGSAIISATFWEHEVFVDPSTPGFGGNAAPAPRVQTAAMAALQSANAEEPLQDADADRYGVDLVCNKDAIREAFAANPTQRNNTFEAKLIDQYCFEDKPTPDSPLASFDRALKQLSRAVGIQSLDVATGPAVWVNEDSFPNDFNRMDQLDNPGGSTNFATATDTSTHLGWDFQGSDLTTLYAVTSGDEIYAIDATTGAETLQGIGVGVGTAYALTYSPFDDTFYATDSFDNLYSVDVTNGSFTLIGTINVPQTSGLWVALAADPDTGTLYAYEWFTDSLYSVDASNASASLIGSTGAFSASSFETGLDFDDTDNTLYLVLDDINAGSDAILATVDIGTGSRTVVGQLLQNNVDIDSASTIAIEQFRQEGEEEEPFNGFVRNLVGLGAVSVERTGTRLNEDVPGDEAAGSRGIPFATGGTTGLEFCTVNLPICPGQPFANEPGLREP